jgi:hypothetical protein
VCSSESSRMDTVPKGSRTDVTPMRLHLVFDCVLDLVLLRLEYFQLVCRTLGSVRSSSFLSCGKFLRACRAVLSVFHCFSCLIVCLRLDSLHVISFVCNPFHDLISVSNISVRSELSLTLPSNALNILLLNRATLNVNHSNFV